uniref:sulfatase n=1 Tax=Devosia algicola TaxID=3026418 RepID=UPI002E1B31E9
MFVLFDSLNRLALGAYGGSVPTPNYDRFAARGAVFDRHYAGSLPCMPARRDMHTGRLNFMHRSWGPLEPFDNSLPRELSKAGIYSHLITDHLHYFEDGGSGYVNAFDSWEFIRGQEYDATDIHVRPPVAHFEEHFAADHYPTRSLAADKTATRFNVDAMEFKRSRHMISTMSMKDERDYPLSRCFQSAFRFLDNNHTANDWFLQLECFDPHEPFDAPARFRDAFPTAYVGKTRDWPHYQKVTDSDPEIAENRSNYAALLTMCDAYFGQLLDYFDAHDLWKDTCLILSTDHGFLLSEHNWWGKNCMPAYEEISHIPLIIHIPNGTANGKHIPALSQTTDLMPTILEMAGIAIPPETTGHSLLPLMQGQQDGVRDVAVFGVFGGPLGVTDGRYTYYLPADADSPLDMYTLMPAHLRKPFDIDELAGATQVQSFDFTKGVPLLKVRLTPTNSQTGADGLDTADAETMLFDLDNDPGQMHPVRHEEIEQRLLARASREFRRHDTPEEFYERYNLETA